MVKNKNNMFFTEQSMRGKRRRKACCYSKSFQKTEYILFVKITQCVGKNVLFSGKVISIFISAINYAKRIILVNKRIKIFLINLGTEKKFKLINLEIFYFWTALTRDLSIYGNLYICL